MPPGQPGVFPGALSRPADTRPHWGQGWPRPSLTGRAAPTTPREATFSQLLVCSCPAKTGREPQGASAPSKQRLLGARWPEQEVRPPKSSPWPGAQGLGQPCLWLGVAVVADLTAASEAPPLLPARAPRLALPGESRKRPRVDFAAASWSSSGAQASHVGGRGPGALGAPRLSRHLLLPLCWEWPSLLQACGRTCHQGRGLCRQPSPDQIWDPVV